MIETTSTAALLNLATGHVTEAALLVAAMLACAMGRFWAGSALLAVSITAFALNMSGFNSSSLPGLGEDPHRLDIVSISVRSSNPDASGLIREISRRGYDIIALQEVADLGLLKANRQIQQDYNVYYLEGKSTVILSKLPAIAHENIRNLQKLVVRTAGGSIMVIYNLHAPKFFLDINNYNVFFGQLLDDLHRIPEASIIIVGDFNSSKNNYWRKKLRQEEGFNSALHDSGRGWLATFPTGNRVYGKLFPFLSIDDIYVKGATIISARVLKEHHGSDHYPVHATINLSRP